MSLVTDFGAVGDGKADDTQALQHAMDDGDGLIELPRGTYKIDRPLVVDLTKQGYRGIRGPNGAARIVMTGPGPAIHLIGDHRGTADPGSVKPQTWDKERFPVLTGFEILGRHAEADGIRLQKTMQCTIHAVLIRDCRYGIHLTERNRNFLLTNCHVYHNRAIGVFFDRVNLHQINIIGNHISYNPIAGIKISGGEVRNLQITGNDIEYNYDVKSDGSADVWIDTSQPGATMRELTIASNTIQARPSPDGANIRIEGAPSKQADQSGLIAITGNLLGSQEKTIHLRHTRGVTITGNSIYSGKLLSLHAEKCRNIVVGANSVDYNLRVKERHEDGIRFDDCVGCSVSGTVIEDCRHPAGAIALHGCADMAVTGCQIFDPGEVGIGLENCQACRISDNTVRDRRDMPRMKTAIRVGGDSSANLIQNNLVHKANGAGISAAANTAVVQGNVVL